MTISKSLRKPLNVARSTAIGICALLIAGCASREKVASNVSFSQNSVCIFLPVKVQKSASGNILMSAINDGGTRRLTFWDARNHKFELYYNHRIGFEKTWGDYYLDGLPGSASAVRILDRSQFEKTVLRDIDLRVFQL